MAEYDHDYLSHFRFRYPPFSITPDPDFFYPSRGHVGVLESLKYGILRGDGFLVLTGHAGTGKSLLLRLLLKRLDERFKTAIVVTPMIRPEGLLKMLLEELSGETLWSSRDGDMTGLLREFRDLVIGLAERGRRVLVVIDEAQNLSVETLEQLRLLSNIELKDKKLIQILLAGQEGLQDLLVSKGLGQLSQRITVSEHLEPLRRDECLEYIRYRMARAGRADIEIEPAAARHIHRQTCGIPRLVNRLMDRTLLAAAARGKTVIDLEAVKAAEETMEILKWQRSSKEGQKASFCPAIRRFAPAAAGAALIFSVFSMTIFPAHDPDRGSNYTKAVFDPASLGLDKEYAKETPARTGSRKGGTVVEVRVDRALVRTKPARKFPQITTASRGDRLRVTGSSNGWFRVEVFDAVGRRTQGWIRKDMVVMPGRELPVKGAEAGPSSKVLSHMEGRGRG